MPRPPPSLRSSARIGQGLRISKKRNAIKPASHQPQWAGNNTRVIQMPTNSSQTIPPWSCTPRSSATLPHSQTPNTEAVAMISSANGKLISCSSGTNASPASVPQVPGALRARPLPKPKAKKCQKLLHTRGCLVIMGQVPAVFKVDGPLRSTVYRQTPPPGPVECCSRSPSLMAVAQSNPVSFKQKLSLHDHAGAGPLTP